MKNVENNNFKNSILHYIEDTLTELILSFFSATTIVVTAITILLNVFIEDFAQLYSIDSYQSVVWKITIILLVLLIILCIKIMIWCAQNRKQNKEKEIKIKKSMCEDIIAILEERKNIYEKIVLS